MIAELIPPETKALMTRIQRHDINYIRESLDMALEDADDRHVEGVRRNIHDAVSRIKFVLEQNYPINEANFLELVFAQTKKVSDFTIKLRPSPEKDEILYDLNRLTAMRGQVAQQQHSVPEFAHS
jgi:hypothetical protein